MARYGIRAEKVFGVSMATMRPLVKRLGRNHALAQALWASEWHEARILAALVDEPAAVTRRQMDAWARGFENWAVCDGACIHLFVRTPHAWAKVRQWSRSRHEFVRRAAFSLLAALAVHDPDADDRLFLAQFPLIVRAATDKRSMVSKAVNWALRQVGQRNRRSMRGHWPLLRGSPRLLTVPHDGSAPTLFASSPAPACGGGSLEKGDLDRKVYWKRLCWIFMFPIW